MRNFVFDLYGTLADIRTDEDAPAFRRAFLRACGQYFGEDFFEKYPRALRDACGGDPLREPDLLAVFCALARENGTTLDTAEAKRVARVFREYSRERLALYAGVQEMLAALRARGARLYILSNAQSAFTAPEIEALGLASAVDGVELSSDVGYKKPSEKFFRHILTKYDLAPEETVFVGNDLEADVIGARRAGLTPVYIHTAISPQEDTPARASALADYVATDHAALSALLLSLC